MDIKTIIFDLGNVVLTNDWHYNCPEKFQEYSDHFDITQDDMERGWKAAWPEFSVGEISEEDFWKIFLENADAKNIDIEIAKNLWRKYQKPIENTFELLKKLKQHYRLAALTTISKEWLDYKREKYNLDEYFEVIISSGYSGLIKPHDEIYELAAKELKEKLGVNPEECLFVDDAKSNLLPAEKLGIKTVLFTKQAELEKELKELGIRYDAIENLREAKEGKTIPEGFSERKRLK